MKLELDRQDWWDIGFASALCALPLLAWWTTFDGPGWWIVGLLGLVVGIGVTVWVIVMGGGLDKALAAAVVAYIVVCGPVAHGGIGGGMFSDGLQGTARGWTLLAGTHPWVDASGFALLPVLQLTLLGSATVIGLAMHSRSPSLPLLPASALLIATLFTGRTEPVSVIVHGLVFGAIAVSWVRQRSRLVEGVPIVGGSVAAQATSLLPAAGVVVVAAAVAGLATGATDLDQRTVLRSVVPAHEVADRTTPLDEYTFFTKQKDAAPGNVYARPILTTTGAPEGTRLRFATLDQYDGERWFADNDTDATRGDDRYLRVSSRIDNPAPGDRITVNAAPMADWVGEWVATPGALESLDFLPGAQLGAPAWVRYNLATRTAVMTDGHGLTDRDLYSATGRVHDPELTSDMVPSGNLDRDLYEAAAFLDPAVESWSAGATSPADAVLQIAAKLKKVGQYSSDDAATYGPGHSEERLGQGFLLSKPTVGNEEQYAAAMALMANRLGVPARVAVGAEVPADGIIRGKDVSAWVELLAADGTWHVLDSEEFTSETPAPEQGGSGDDPGAGQKERVFPERTPDDTKQKPPEEMPQPPPPQGGGEDGENTDDAEEDGAPMWPWFLLAALVLLVAAAVVPVLKWWRRRRRLSAARVADRYVGAWSELLDHARDLGHRVPSGLTRPAEAGHLDRTRLTPLAQQADIKVFGPDEPDPAEAAEFWSLVDAELSELSGKAPLTRRLWALFNPTSLLR